MTKKKEHLLAIRPTIEYDVFSDILNDVLKAMITIQMHN